MAQDSDRTPDDLPLRFAAHFGFGLMVYLLIGMLLFIATAAKYSGKPQLAVFLPPAVGLLASFSFAIFARIVWKWRGFLWGAMMGSTLIVLLAIAFFTFVTIASFDLRG